MKKIALGFLGSFMSLSLMAQTEKGKMIVGGNLGNIGGAFTSGAVNFNISVNPNAGYFVKDNLAIGLGMQSTFSYTSSETGTSYTSYQCGIAPFVRYYLAPIINAHPYGSFFMNADAGLYSVKGLGLNNVSVSGGGGYAYFLNPNVSLEAIVSLRYQHNLKFNSNLLSPYLGLGFQVHLPSSILKCKKPKTAE